MQNASHLVTAESARKTAKIFYYGNIISVVLPIPFFILWFGGAILIYALFRHHPNPRVGYYTQIGAYYYYALAGSLIPVLTFASSMSLIGWVVLWVIFMVIMLPLSIRQILRVNKEVWHDTKISDDKGV